MLVKGYKNSSRWEEDVQDVLFHIVNQQCIELLKMLMMGIEVFSSQK